MWRKVRKITLWVMGIAVSLVLILAFVIWLMQDKIKAYAIDYLNQHLKTELKVKQLDVTFLSTFPDVSLRFKQVTILDPEGLQPYRDTLLSAQNLYLKFNLWDVLASTYKPKQLEVYNGHLRAFINTEGKENYDILKPQPKTPTKNEFKLELKHVKLYNTRLTYHNAHGGQRYKIRTQEMDFAGEFTKEVFDIKAKGDAFIMGFHNKNLTVFKNQASEIDLILGVNNAKKTLTFKKGDWRIGKMHLGIKGQLDFVAEGTKCAVDVFGKNISLVSIIQLLPDKARANIGRYKSFGNINLAAAIKGTAGKTTAPDVNATFSIKEGILIEKKTNISLHNIDLAGTYTNKNKLGLDELNLNQAQARFKDGKFSLKGKLTDFTKPHFVFTVVGDFGLATLHDFIDPETVKEMSGEVHLDSKLDFVLARTDDLLLVNALVNEASGEVSFKNATVLIHENGKPITDFNGVLNLKDNDALVDNLKGKIGESDFTINGAIKNFTPYFLSGNQSLSIVGGLSSNKCNINDLIVKTTTQQPVQENTSTTPLQGYTLPDRIQFNFDLNINQLEWAPFTAQDVRGNFKLLDKKLSASNLNIVLAGGKCTGVVDVDETANGFNAKANAAINGVQLPLLLKAFNNFGQELITPENAKGTLTATVEWVLPINKQLQIDAQNMLSQASITIKNGELNNVDQLKKLADFMRTDKKLKLFLQNDADDFEKRVRQLKFDELKNDLTIRNGMLTIPKMEINSSAIKINFAGTHSFSNKIDYHFNFRFIELKRKNQDSEFGEIADDGTGLKVYIRMFGDLSQPQYAWDKQEKKAERQEQWQKEKETFKSIIKEEFGFFKRDTTVKTQQPKAEDVKFILEWDENNSNSKQDPSAEKENQKVKRIKKKMGIDEGATKDIKFEIEQ